MKKLHELVEVQIPIAILDRSDGAETDDSLDCFPGIGYILYIMDCTTTWTSDIGPARPGSQNMLFPLQVCWPNSGLTRNHCTWQKNIHPKAATVNTMQK